MEAQAVAAGCRGDRLRRRSPTCCRWPSRSTPTLSAQRYKDQARASGWTSPIRSSGEIVKELSLGLQDLGIERGDKVGILSNTRPEWTYSDFAILCAGRDRRADLPDELARGVPVRARALRVEGRDPRGRGAAREDPQGPRPAAEPRARDLDRADRGRRRDHAGRRCASAAAPRSSEDFEQRIAGGASRRTSPPTSTRPARPARPRAASSTTPTGATCSTWSQEEDVLVGGRGRLPVPAARARVRAPDPARRRSTSARRSSTGRRTRRRSSPT